MSATEIDRAFAPFTQIGAARTRSSDGLGLGLSLARKIFTDQQITLTLDAKPGEGLTARLVVPPNAARRPESARITAAS
jgi:signal transduction histidine kinase